MQEEPWVISVGMQCQSFTNGEHLYSLVEATEEGATAIAEMIIKITKSELFDRIMKIKEKDECCNAKTEEPKAKYIACW